MMNVGLVILWIVVFLLIVMIAVIILYTLIRPSGGVVGVPCEQAVSTANLIPLAGKPCCAGSINHIDQQLNMILAPFPTSYRDVCATYCDEGQYNTTNDTCGSGDVDGFNRCIAALRPRQCSGLAMPIGIDGTIYYYGYTAYSTNVCPQTAPCESV